MKLMPHAALPFGLHSIELSSDVVEVHRGSPTAEQMESFPPTNLSG